MADMLNLEHVAVKQYAAMIASKTAAEICQICDLNSSGEVNLMFMLERDIMACVTRVLTLAEVIKRCPNEKGLPCSG